MCSQPFSAASNGLQSAIGKINGTVNDINSVFGQVNQVFTNVDDTLGLFQRVLEKDSDGNRHVIRAIVDKLITDQSQSLGLPDTLADNIDTSVLSDALMQIEPTLAEIQSELEELKQDLDDAHDEFTQATGGVQQVLNAITNATGEVQDFVQQSENDVSNLVATAETTAGDYFTADPAVAQNGHQAPNSGGCISQFCVAVGLYKKLQTILFGRQFCAG